MLTIEELTERLILTEKTAALEEKQRRRLMESSSNRQQAKSDDVRLPEASAESNSLLDQEDAHRKLVVDNMVQNCSASNGPVVKVLVNVQGIKNNRMLSVSLSLSIYI